MAFNKGSEAVKGLQDVAKPGHVLKLRADDYVAFQYESSEDAMAGMARAIEQISAAAISNKGSFVIAIAGGSLVNSLGKLAGSSSCEWSRWHVFWVDERNVALDSDDSNFKAAHDAWLSKVRIPDDQVHTIHPGCVVKASQDYEGQLQDAVQAGVLRCDDSGMPCFDAMLLGCGPDGHIASLFPGKPSLQERTAWVLPINDSPKPPPERITLTLPCINAARVKMFMITGASKADMVARALQPPAGAEKLPNELVEAQDGCVIWILDHDSSSKLRS